MSKPAFAGVSLGLALAAALFTHQRQTTADAPPGWADDAPRLRQALSSVAPGPRPIGSETLTLARRRLQVALRGLGISAEEEARFVCGPFGGCGSVTNLVARLPGAPGVGALILSAHLDTVPASPGAHDDGLGVAALFDVAGRLAAREAPLPRPVILLFDDGEEVGLLGAQAFVEAHPDEAEGAAAFITVDGVAGPTTFRSRGPAQAELTRALGCMPRPFGTGLERAWAPLIGGFDDSHLFGDLGVSSVTLAGQEGYDLYHTPLDVPDAVTDATLVDRVASTWGVVRCYLDAPGAPGPAVREGYGDVLGLALLSASPWAAAAWAALVLVWCGWAARRPGLGWMRASSAGPGLGSGPAGGLAEVLMVAGLGGGLALFGRALGVEAAAGRAAAAGLVLVGLAVALAARGLASWMATVARGSARRGAVGDLSEGLLAPSRSAWALIAVSAAAALALAVSFPEGAVVALVPAGAGALVALALALHPRGRPWAWPAGGAVAGALLVAAAGTASRLAPGGGGALGAVFAGLPLALSAAGLMPAAAGLRTPKGVRWGALALLAAGLVGVVSPWRAAGRQGGALRLVDGPAEQSLQVLGPVAPAWQSNLRFVTRAQAYPWSSGDHPVQAAPVTVSAAPAPEVHVVARAPQSVQVELRSGRRATDYRVALPPDTPVVAMAVQGREAPFGPDAIRWTWGWRVISIYGVAGPVRLELTTTASAAVTLRVGDVQPGLPPPLAELAAARPPTLVQAHQGDVWERWVEVTLR